MADLSHTPPDPTQSPGPSGGVLIAYESDKGRAPRAAGAMAEAVSAFGYEPVVRLMDEVAVADVVGAGTLLVGGCVKIRYPFGGATIEHVLQWIDGLPRLDGKQVGVFCTYRFFPNTFSDTTARVSEALGRVKRAFEAKGAVVVADRALHMRLIEESSTAFAQAVLTWPLAS